MAEATAQDLETRPSGGERSDEILDFSYPMVLLHIALVCRAPLVETLLL
jgi:hypothetical protein